MSSYKLSPLVILLGSAMSLPVAAHPTGYGTDIDGNILLNPFGECIRSIDWSADKAVAACGGEMKPMKPMKKAAAAPMDADGDGVMDANDNCANTPAGVVVDDTGCPVDLDNDGVADSNDQCLETAPNVAVDATGCPADADNDGVPDSYDQCLTTAPGVEVYANGCETDGDNDGVVDSQDRCPSSAPGDAVNQFGCTVVTDSDNDGIIDPRDECPNTVAGTPVDRTGCELQADLRLDNVQFNTATADLSGGSVATLDEVAAVLLVNDHLKFEVAGHTDSLGNYDYNVSLSQQRAEAVREYLISKGVPASQLTARGYGPDKPVATNSTSAGRAQNRRVELVLQ